MIRKKVLGIGATSTTLLVQDNEANGELRVLRRISVANWAPHEVKAAYDFYSVLLRMQLPLFVPLHSVVLQNSFLNVVTAYCPEGDLTTFIEDELESALPSKLALQWLLVLAHAVRQLQNAAHLCFYGLSLDRVYRDTQRGVAGIVVGMPLPPCAYFRAMQERRSDGIALEREYPPEVLAAATTGSAAAASNGGGGGSGSIASQYYHPQLSDVWHLGLLGVRLFSAHSALARRSAAVRDLLAQMMAPAPSERLSLDGVIMVLASLAGPMPRLAALTSVLNHTTRETSGGGGNDNGCHEPPRRPATTMPLPVKTTSSGHDTLTTTSEKSSTVDSEPPVVHSTQVTSNRVRRSPPQAGNVRRNSTRDTNNDNSINTGVGEEASGLGIGVARPRRPARGEEDSWQRRTMAQFDELQQLNRSPHKRVVRHVSPYGRASPAPRSPRAQQLVVDDNDAVFATLEQAPAMPPPPLQQQQPRPVGVATSARSAARRGSVTPPRSEEHNVTVGSSHSPSPSQSHSQRVDSNTRALREMLSQREDHDARREELEWRRRQQEEAARHATDVHRKHVEHMRDIMQGANVRQDDIRRHIQDWRRHNHDDTRLFDSDGVVIVNAVAAAAAATGAAAAAGGTTATTRPQASTPSSSTRTDETHSQGVGKRADVPVTVMVPKTRPPPLLASAGAMEAATSAGNTPPSYAPQPTTRVGPAAVLVAKQRTAAAAAESRNGGNVTAQATAAPQSAGFVTPSHKVPPKPFPFSSTTTTSNGGTTGVTTAAAGGGNDVHPGSDVGTPTRAAASPVVSAPPSPPKTQAQPASHLQPAAIHCAPPREPPPRTAAMGAAVPSVPTSRATTPVNQQHLHAGEGGAGQVAGAPSVAALVEEQVAVAATQPATGPVGPHSPHPKARVTTIRAAPRGAAATTSSAVVAGVADVSDSLDRGRGIGVVAVERRSSSPTQARRGNVTALAATEWAIDGLRSAIRGLVRSRELYAEVMTAVAAFVQAGEEERMLPCVNETFMQNLRSVCGEERLYMAIAPLCAQLAALEGLAVSIHSLQQVQRL